MIRLTIETPDGQGYDVTHEAEDLTFSNVKPGGDETATFTLKRSWLNSNPEVKRGATVRITDGLDVLWQGRLEDVNRTSSGSEVMKITCYGLGVRLKDDLFRQIFVDRDLSKWTGASRARRIVLGAGLSAGLSDPEVTDDNDAGLPALHLPLVGAWAVPMRCDAMWDSGDGLTWASIYYDVQSIYKDGNISGPIYSSSGDGSGFEESSGDILPATGTVATGYYTPGTARRWAMIELFEAATGGVEGTDYGPFFRKLVVYGPTGLTRQGSNPGGFTADQIVGYIVGLVNGIKARLMQAQAFVIPQSSFTAPTSHEDGVKTTNELAGANWGTWGPDNVLDRSDTGYFDYAQPDDDAVWIASRVRADDVDLSDKLGSLFNRLEITWKDDAGTESIEVRTAVIPALDDADIVHTQSLDLGNGTQAAAQQLGDVFFALQGANPPASGSVQMKAGVYHRDRGWLPPHYMRADGSNVKIPEALPYSDAVGLGDVDRRTIFPIQRVTVDCSSDAPQTTVEIDQGQDLISVLQARITAAAEAT